MTTINLDSDMNLDKDAEIFQLKSQLQNLLYKYQVLEQFFQKLQQGKDEGKNDRLKSMTVVSIEAQTSQALLQSYQAQVKELEELSESQGNHIRNLERTINDLSKALSQPQPQSKATWGWF